MNDLRLQTRKARTESQRLRNCCREALRLHLACEDAASLSAARDLGVQAVAEGLRLIDTTDLLHRVVSEVVSPDTSGSHPDWFQRYASFASEFLSAFDGSQRGTRETNAVLQRINERREDDIRRIAHEIHDSTGQLMVTVYLALEEAGRELGSAAARLEPVRERLGEVELELRRLAHELRPTVLDDLGLMSALRQMADGLHRRTGLSVHVTGGTRERLAQIVEVTLYRVVQEALANVVHHASADMVEVTVRQDATGLRCRVSDDGVGFDPAAVGSQVGLGLASMRERLAPLGGALRIEAAPGNGATIHVDIPVRTPDACAHRTG